MKDDGISPVFPDNPAEYLTTWLFEIGPAVPAGMGESAIDWPHLKAWQETMGVELLPWEARILRRLSGDFVAQRAKSRKPDCPAPYTGDADRVKLNRGIVADKVASVFGGMAKRVGRAEDR